MVTEDDDAVKFAGEWDEEGLRKTHRLLPTQSMRQLRRLHEHRLHFESLHGPTPDRQYATFLPDDEQLAMWHDRPQEYIDGMPPFAQDYFQLLCEDRNRAGKLDDLADSFVRVFVGNRGQLSRQR